VHAPDSDADDDALRPEPGARRAVAVVLDGPPTPAWQARALANTEAAPRLEVVEVRLTGPPRRDALRRLHARVERRLFGLGADALAPVAVAARGDGERVPRLVVWLAERRAPAGEPGEVLILRHGGVHEPAQDAFRRAVAARAPGLATDAVLRRPDGTTLLVERTVSGVRPFSETLSRDLALWKLAALVARAAERAPGRGELAPADGRPARVPSAPAFAVRAALRWARALAVRLLFRRPWSIRVRRRGADPARGWSREEGLVRWGEARVHADPVLFEHEGGHHLFCEAVAAGSARGVIAHTELRLDGTPADPPRPVLEAPIHLSYPFVFAHGGAVFMIPETSAARRVELYRATAFPHAWEREAVLLDGVDAADATLLEHDGRLWLFASVAAPGASSLDELHLFWAGDLHGPWHPHPRNPIVSDVRCARPAGPIQRWDGRLVRPGQDGSRRYGGAVSFRQIDVLTTSDYAEREIAQLDPADVGARATHAYTATSAFEAVDLRRRAPRLQARLRQKAGGRAGR
jgi:hypothetical protein